MRGSVHGRAASTLIRLGKLDRADLILATAGNLPWLTAIRGRCRGVLAAARDDINTAATEFGTALDRHRLLGMPFEVARTQFEFGCTLRRTQRRAEARIQLSAAIATFELLSAPQWERAARVELERIPGSRPAADSMVLTPSEERIARLVCDGLTNSQIADRIPLSTKTVESNLSRIYRKLDVQSRIQLVRVLAK